MDNMEKLKILIAEDDRISSEYLKEVLKAKNTEILVAGNGEEAVEQCRKHPDIDLVLMDIKMPKKDGKQATRDIKALRPNLPIVAQTAYAFDDEREKILHDGFDAYLAKPIRRSDIMSVIEQFIKKS